MLRGLRQAEPKLKAAGIPFFLLQARRLSCANRAAILPLTFVPPWAHARSSSPESQGAPEDTIPELTARLNAGLLVTDYTPLRTGRAWREAVAGKIACPFREARHDP